MKAPNSTKPTQLHNHSGESIGVCADDPDKSCTGLGLPPPGRKITTAPPRGFGTTEVDDHEHGHEHEDGDDHEHSHGATEAPPTEGDHTHEDGGHSHEGTDHSHGATDAPADHSEEEDHTHGDPHGATDAPKDHSEEGGHTHEDGGHSHESIEHSHGATDAPADHSEEEDHTHEDSHGATDAPTDHSEEGEHTHEDVGHSHEGTEHSHGATDAPTDKSEPEVESAHPPSEENVSGNTQDSAAVLARGMISATIIASCFAAYAPLLAI